MPLYTYACDDHGQFSAWGRMSESDQAQPCPSCAGPAPRVLARPAIGGRSGGGRDDVAASCGMGACGMGDGSPVADGGSGCCGRGGCCGDGACMH